MECDFRRDGDWMVCAREECQQKIPAVNEEWGPEFYHAQCGDAVPGLGDYTEQLLSAFGVTQERWSEAKAAVGLPPECACAERQEQLNDWGRRVTKWWAGQS